MENNKEKQLGIERSNRLKRLRNATRLSRSAFAKKHEQYGLKKTNIQNWEDVRWKGLTDRGAQQLIKAFADEGFDVTLEYLMFGIGKDPLDSTSIKLPDSVIKLSEKSIIANELKLFYKFNDNAVDSRITDDSLAPFIMPGDYVAGSNYFDDDIKKAVGYLSIVHTIEGEVVVRMVEEGKDKEHFTLTCLNQKTKAAHSILINIKLLSAAPVLWIRRPNLK